MATPATPGRSYEFGPFRLDPANRVLLRGEQVVPLPPKVVETLLVLVAHRGHTVGKDELIRAVWPDTFVEESNLTHNISVLRKTLGETSIETIPKRGYRLVMPVRELMASPAEGEGRGRLSVLPPPPARAWWRKRTLLTVGIAVLATLGALGYLLLRPPSRAPLSGAAFTQLTDQPGQELHPSLSPDGNFFVYASRASGNWDIYLQRVGGRNAVNLTKDCSFDDTQPALSPDGRRIAFRSERDGGGISVMGATGESVVRVTDFGYHPAWSPDGREIVCATSGFRDPNYRRSPGSRLFSVSVETPLAPAGQRLIAGPEDAVQPAWSPHGYRVAYWGLRGGQRDIWTVPAEGGQPVPVTGDPHLDWNPVWSPDAKYLYFASDRGGSMSFWRVRIDERSGKPLGVPELVAMPSPYSGYLSFSRNGRGMCYVQQLLTANVQKVGFDPIRESAEGPPVPITEGSRVVKQPDLSPDGDWVVFATLAAQQDVFLVRADGTGLRQITDDVYLDQGARWSPDGRRIAWQSTRTGKYEIWTMSPDGSSARQITYESRGPVVCPAWAPDGKRLAYSIWGLGTFIIEVEKPWTEQSPQALGPLTEPNTWFWARAWSPDGRRIAGDLQGPTGAYSGVGVYSLESRKYRRLTDFGAFAHWLSDSRRLLFLDESKVYLIDSESGRIREILSVAPNEIAPVFALSRDDRLILFSLQVTEADVWLMSRR